MTAGASAGKNQVRPASQGSVRMSECDFQSQLRAPLKAVGTYHYVHLDGAPPLKRELAMFVYVRAVTTFFYWLSSKTATLPLSLVGKVGMVGKVDGRLPSLPRRSC